MLFNPAETSVSLTQQVETRVRESTHGRIRDLSVEEVHGRVVVRGHVPSHHTKQKKIEHLPLSPPAINLLRTLKQQADGEYVFPGKNGPLKELKASWAAIRDAAGLTETGIRFHDLRHTYASQLVSGGISLHIVGGLLGHTRSETTQRYAHIADEALREATTKFGAIVERADGEREPAEVIPLPART